MSILVKEFQERLQECQDKSGLSQKAFAEQLGIKYMTYRNILNAEHGPYLDTLAEIGNKFGIKKTIWLLTGEEPPELSAGPDVNLGDLDRLLDAARKRAASDPAFAGWLQIELKKVID